MRIILYLLSALPLKVLYAKSYILFLLLFYVTGYRRGLVFHNLELAFPEKTEKELYLISKKFYLNLSRFVVESIKTFSMSKKQLLELNEISNGDYQHFNSQEKQVVVLTAHFFNWEWAGLTVGLSSDKLMKVVYKPLRNKTFNIRMQQLRENFGNKAVPMKNILRSMVTDKNKAVINCFLADQTPTRAEAGIWLPFMNRMTPFFTGYATAAAKLALPVYFAWPLRTGNKYEIHFKLITLDASISGEKEVMEKYVSLLEKAISTQPENWLWSHNRWKHEYLGKSSEL